MPQYYAPRPSGESPGPIGPAPVAPSVQTQHLDDLLDEIDEVLETQAETFVRGFVQKGGQ